MLQNCQRYFISISINIQAIKNLHFMQLTKKNYKNKPMSQTEQFKNKQVVKYCSKNPTSRSEPFYFILHASIGLSNNALC